MPVMKISAKDYEESVDDDRNSNLRGRKIPDIIPAGPLGFRPHFGAKIAYSREISDSSDEIVCVRFRYEWQSYHALLEWQKEEAVVFDVYLPDSSYETIACLADSFRGFCGDQLGDRCVCNGIGELCNEVLTVRASDCHLETAVPTLNKVSPCKMGNFPSYDVTQGDTL